MDEYSTRKNSENSSQCYSFFGHSEIAEKKSEMEYSSEKLSRFFLAVYRIRSGVIKLVERKIDFDSEMDQIIDRLVKYGESRSSVIKRVLLHADKDSNFYNQQ